MNAGITTRQTVGGISGIVLMALGFATYECWRSLMRIHSTSDLMRIARWDSSQKDCRCHWLALRSQRTQWPDLSMST